MYKYLFENFLKYKELYSVLAKIWIKHFMKKDNMKKIKELETSVIKVIKSFSGLKIKKDTNEWKMIISNPNNALYYLLNLYNSLIEEVKQVSKKQSYSDNDSYKFLLKLLENLF